MKSITAIILMLFIFLLISCSTSSPEFQPKIKEIEIMSPDEWLLKNKILKQVKNEEMGVYFVYNAVAGTDGKYHLTFDIVPIKNILDEKAMQVSRTSAQKIESTIFYFSFRKSTNQVNTGQWFYISYNDLMTNNIPDTMYVSKMKIFQEGNKDFFQEHTIGEEVYVSSNVYVSNWDDLKQKGIITIDNQNNYFIKNGFFMKLGF